MLTNFRFHNGTLLEKSVHPYDETLVLRNLRMDQAGEYYCRASNENGAIKSNPAILSVIGEPFMEYIKKKKKSVTCSKSLWDLFLS